MTNNTSPQKRLLMAVICFLGGILAMTLIPKFGGLALDSVMQVGWSKIDESGEIAPKMVSLFFPFWIGLSMIAGLVLLLLSVPIYHGQYWARPLALGILAIPCITAAFLFGPIMVTSRHLAPQAIIMLGIGLIPYFSLILLEDCSLPNKLINLAMFLLIGIMSAASFTNGFSSLHDLLYRPEATALTDTQTGFALGVPVVWLGIVLALVGLPFLAGQTKAGWYLTLMGTSSILIGTFVFYLSEQNQFYLASLVISLLVLTLLLMPSIKQNLGLTQDKF